MWLKKLETDFQWTDDDAICANSMSNSLSGIRTLRGQQSHRMRLPSKSRQPTCRVYKDATVQTDRYNWLEWLRFNSVPMSAFLTSVSYEQHKLMVTCTLEEKAYDESPIDIRFPTLGKAAKSIDIIRVYRSGVTDEIEVIFGLHSTCTMNFITHARAYSSYSRAMLEYHVSALHFTICTHEAEAQVKYRQRGWMPIIPKLDFPEVNCFIGDHYTLHWSLVKDRSMMMLGWPVQEDDNTKLNMHSWMLKYVELRWKGTVISFVVLKGRKMVKSYCLSDGMLAKIALDMGTW
ncbi:uncharacterized protein EV420DRAFT_1485549 [Desarmillaria tabescens]|uniref:Uncharacterized protein n=1 Tax=Armillaria tabescens TaxID=1929756 RepID=A0AA39JI28_ARMTA|nr:uncharacterized protein EV420DRAFT_1485549 [Desarmillaria tabescens]KAK0441714.1 hypothetical protein EV420DRAFT_1485549 [Desarmillaria tabescens]